MLFSQQLEANRHAHTMALVSPRDLAQLLLVALVQVAPSKTFTLQAQLASSGSPTGRPAGQSARSLARLLIRLASLLEAERERERERESHLLACLRVRRLPARLRVSCASMWACPERRPEGEGGQQAGAAPPARSANDRLTPARDVSNGQRLSSKSLTTAAVHRSASIDHTRALQLDQCGKRPRVVLAAASRLNCRQKFFKPKRARESWLAN